MSKVKKPSGYLPRYRNKYGGLVELSRMADSYLLNAYRYFRGQVLLRSIDAGIDEEPWALPCEAWDWDDVRVLKRLVASLKYNIDKRGLKP